MNLKRCENGHFYDAEKFQVCPHCAAIGGENNATASFGGQASGDMEPFTVPIRQPGMGNMQPIPGSMQSGMGNMQQGIGNAQPTQFSENMSLKAAVGQAMAGSQGLQEDDGRTISIYQTKIGIEPVTGWLVCVEGAAFGESFQLKSGRNFIGRAQSMDIVIAGDNSISREKHAIILYEPKKREFIAQAGESRELFYLNDEVVLNPVRLKQHDIVTVGNTKLMFFPCCSEKFSWEDYKEQEKEGN